MPAWGIDLGGTKIEGVVLNDDGSVLARTRIPTEADRGYAHIISQIAALIRVLAEQTGLTPQSVGIGTPGVLDPKLLTMKNCNTTCLNGMPLKRDLESQLQLPISMANDANCFALAEAALGAGKGAHSLFGVIMGTGVGGGIVIDGKVLHGHQGIAGEWGHNVLDPQGVPCYCGKRGCVERVLSGPALEEFYQSRSGTQLPLATILARTNDPAALATIDRMVEMFASALSVIINILDPEVIVLGGGVSNAAPLYHQGIGRLSSYVFNNRMETRIVKNQLGDSAGVFGAAMLTRN